MTAVTYQPKNATNTPKKPACSQLGKALLYWHRNITTPSRRRLSVTVRLTAYSGVEKIVSEIVLCELISNANR
jgi:hypothetical protein